VVVLAVIALVFLGLPIAAVLIQVPWTDLLALLAVVGGVALLAAFGRRGLVGGPLYDLTGFSLPFTPAAVVMAEAFVALPFLVITVEAAIRNLDTRYDDAAATLGASPWFTMRRITLPMIAPALLAGAVLAWARALGEFGATITFAGNFPGVTQTLPLAVYTALETNRDAALALSFVLIAVCIGVLIALRDRFFRRRA